MTCANCKHWSSHHRLGDPLLHRCMSTHPLPVYSKQGVRLKAKQTMYTSRECYCSAWEAQPVRTNWIDRFLDAVNSKFRRV